MNKAKSHSSVQRAGRFLSGMIMPNIGAFIAWGLITTLFIGPGWMPNEKLAQLVGPMLKALLPILIGYTGGKMIGGTRGGVVGSVATFGVIMGAGGAVNIADGTPMLSGAMLVGPLGGFAIKKIDDALEGKIKVGFEMLVNNFTAGISGMLLAILGFVTIGPVIQAASNAVSAATQAIVNAGLLPLVSIIVEPAKVLFLNNTLNWGIFAPLGVAEVAETGKSIFFLIETNPGPGLGILLACLIFGKGLTKESAPGAIIIHFLGGIHEIYFPYILAKPLLVLAAIGGGMAGVLTNTIFNAGLIAGPSPGSIFMLLAMTPKGGFITTLLGVTAATVVSFLISAVIFKRSKDSDEDLEAAKERMIELKGKKSSVVKTGAKKIVVACDAGMGSSAMGAGILRTKIKNAGLNIEVLNTAIEDIPKDSDIVITHEKLTDRAKVSAPDAEHISLDDFVNTTVYDEVVELLAPGSNVESISETEVEKSSAILSKKNIKLGLGSVSKQEAIIMAGQLLVDSGYVEPEYIDAMLQREEDLTTYIGNGAAIPHGVSEAKTRIKKTGIAILQFPDGIDFGEGIAYLVIGIAGIGNEHLMILANLAEILEEEAKVEELRYTTDLDYIYKQFTNQ